MKSIGIRKPLKVFIIAIISVAAFFVISSIIVSVFYEKALVRYMKNYLDEHLLTRLTMEDINFRFLKGFPKATIEIKNAVLLSGIDFNRKDFTGTTADTLLHARSVMLQFNLLKLFHKDYELKKIEISEGSMNVLFDKKKKHNLNIWKSSESTGREYSVNLRNIVLTKTRVHFISLKDQFSLLTYSEKSYFKGSLSTGVLSGEVHGDLAIKSFNLKENTIIRDARLQMAMNMIYGGNRLRISKGNVQVNKAVAAVEGEFKFGRGSTIDMSLTMNRFGLEEVMSIVPKNTKFSVGNYDFNGHGQLQAVVKGNLSDPDHLLIRSSFELNNCTARNIKNRKSLTHLNLKGTLSGTNAKNFLLQLDTLSADLGKGKINCSFSLGNLKTLAFQSRLHAIIDLQALKEFAGIDSIEKMTGIIRSEIKAAGNLKRITADSSAIALDFIENGIFIFEDAGFYFKNIPLSMEHISGRAVCNKIVHLDSMRLRINETDLLVTGNIKNLSAFILKKGLLKPDLQITTDILDITKYLNHSKSSKSSTGYKSLSVFPADIYMKARVRAGSFIAGKFTASHVSFEMSALKDSIFLDKIILMFPDGLMRGDALITVDESRKISLTCNAQPQKINIQQLFYAFNNFTQHFIIDKNIKGLLDGTINFYAQWDSTLKVMPASMMARGDFQIINGELVQFEPMLKLSKYIDIDELKHIRFKTLKNTIFIKDRIVHIPEMNINSSAFDISVSGQHSFDNLFDYRMRVLLSDVLFNKPRKKKKEIDEFLVEETLEDQTTIPLIVAGTPAKFDVKFDRRKAFNLTRSTMKNTSVKPDTRQPVPENFKIEWEEPVEKKDQKKENETGSSSDIIIEWEE